MGNPHTHMRGVWLKGFSLVEKGRGGLEEDTPLLATKDKEESVSMLGAKLVAKKTQRLHQFYWRVLSKEEKWQACLQKKSPV